MVSSKDSKPAFDAGEDATLGHLSSTVGTFASRIKRKLKEQEEREVLSQQAASVRHGLMLKAMTTTRKTLQETCKISLGNRFSLDLEVGDFEGWPRIELFLVDSFKPENRDCCMMVSASDRKDSGAIILALRSGEVLGRLELKDERELERLPPLLKRGLRLFLDVVAAYVIDEQRREETKNFEPVLSAVEEEPDAIGDDLKDKDLFQEEMNIGDKNTVSADEEVAPLDFAAALLKS